MTDKLTMGQIEEMRVKPWLCVDDNWGKLCALAKIGRAALDAEPVAWMTSVNEHGWLRHRYATLEKPRGLSGEFPINEVVTELFFGPEVK